MNNQHGSSPLDRPISMSEIISSSLRDDAEDRLMGLDQRLEYHWDKVVTSGDKSAIAFRRELENLMWTHPVHVPFELQVRTRRNFRSVFEPRWIRKTDSESPAVAKANGQGRPKYVTVDLEEIRSQCPAAVLPLVEKAEAEFAAIRAELVKLDAMFDLIVELLRLIERMEGMSTP
jgi:hypothetical protein